MKHTTIQRKKQAKVYGELANSIGEEKKMMMERDEKSNLKNTLTGTTKENSCEKKEMVEEYSFSEMASESRGFVEMI